jgi:branched-chain amino acid transport system substrate-binding protein
MKDETGRQYMNKKIVSGIAIAAAATLAFGAVATAPANAATKTIKLAYMGPLTGGAAFLGTDQIPGAIWAIDQYNRTNPKVKIELVKADSQCDPTVAANVAPGVAADKAIIGVIGTACSGEARNSFPAYKAAGLTMVAPSASAVDLTNRKAKSNGFPIFHRVVANDSFQGPALARYAADGITAPKYYMLDDQSTYGAPLIRENATPTAKKLGTIVGTDNFPDDTKDFTSVVAKVKDSGANIVLFGGYDYTAGPLIKALRDGGYKGVFAGGDGVQTSGFVGLAGGKAIAVGVKMTAADVPFNTLLTAAQLADFTKVTGVKVPGLYAGTAWTAANVFIQCIKEGATNRSAIQKCVNNGTFTDAGGNKFKFDRYGDPTTAAAVGGYIVTKDGETIYDKIA